MGHYRIDCSIQTDCRASGHITGVKIGTTQYTVQEIYGFMNNGDTFYTQGGGSTANVRQWDCACGRGTLRSDSDATRANNLDSLVC